MLAGGLRTLEDLRALRNDEGRRSLLRFGEMPSSDEAGYEFREGNAAPTAESREFLQACERNMSNGEKIVRARSSARVDSCF